MCLSLYSLNNCLLLILLLPRYTYRSIIYHSVYLYCTLLCSPIPVFAISHFCLNNVEYSVRLLSVISYIHTFCHLSCTRCCSCCSYHTGCFSFVLPSPSTRGWLCLGKLSPLRHEWWYCCMYLWYRKNLRLICPPQQCCQPSPLSSVSVCCVLVNILARKCRISSNSKQQSSQATSLCFFLFRISDFVFFCFLTDTAFIKYVKQSNFYIGVLAKFHVFFFHYRNSKCNWIVVCIKW